MTYIAPAEYALPLDIPVRSMLGSPEIDPADVTVVIPVKDDQRGLYKTLASLLRLSPSPRRIRVVDDGSEPPLRLPPLNGHAARVSLVRLPRNQGPACARNHGLHDLSGWVYLTDCGCTHPPDLFERMADARSAGPDHAVAVASPILAGGGGRVGRYMTEQGNLNPPMLDGVPQAVITASVLVHVRAGESIGWFDVKFREAGGEDIDFGLRLRQAGEILWSPAAAVLHEFEASLDDFDRRFRRYGRGMRTLADKWGVSLEPFAFQARSPDLQDLADRQYMRMLEGYRGT